MIKHRLGSLMMMVIATVTFHTHMVAQDTLRWGVQGYVKGMYMASHSNNLGSNMHSGLLHGRLRFDLDPFEQFSFRVDVRNRFYQGDMVDMVQGFSEMLEVDPGVVDLNWTNNRTSGMLLVMNIDRLLVDYHAQRWRVTMGRQRINWGLNTVWNPHDIFNAYDFFDFDYEERPGSDALRVQYQWGGMSGIEAAASMDYDNNVRSALLYRFNRNGYDMQVLTGYSYDRWLCGFGWAGSVGEAGFKGEARYVQPSGSASFENRIVATIGVDRTFDPGWYVGLNGLYTGTDSRLGLESPTVSFSYDRALMLQVNRQINPIWNAGASVFYASENRIALMPSVSRTLGDNWELLLTGIGFYEKNISQNNLFLRLRWSFSS